MTLVDICSLKIAPGAMVCAESELKGDITVGEFVYMCALPANKITYFIYTIIFLKSVCQHSQTAGRNSCTIILGNVSNCSHRMTVHPVTSSRLNSA